MSLWLTADDPATLRLEEQGALRIVDALGHMLATDATPDAPVVGALRTWRAPDVVGLDYGFDDEEPSAGLRLLVTPEAVEFRLPVVSWREGKPVVGTFLWQRMAWKDLERGAIADLVRHALACVRTVRRGCSTCGRQVALGKYVMRDARIVCFGCEPDGAP